MTKHRGFTLLEIMVALFIFAILALITTSALTSFIQSESKTRLYTSRLNELNITLASLSNDLSQTIDQPIQSQPALMGNSESLSFTRTMASKKSDNQADVERITFRLENNTLQRKSTPLTNPPAAPHLQTLMHHIKKISFQFYDDQNHMTPVWPLGKEANPGFPKAVQITITFTNNGDITQIFPIHAASMGGTS